MFIQRYYKRQNAVQPHQEKKGGARRKPSQNGGCRATNQVARRSTNHRSAEGL